ASPAHGGFQRQPHAVRQRGDRQRSLDNVFQRKEIETWDGKGRQKPLAACPIYGTSRPGSSEGYAHARWNGASASVTIKSSPAISISSPISFRKGGSSMAMTDTTFDDLLAQS